MEVIGVHESKGYPNGLFCQSNFVKSVTHPEHIWTVVTSWGDNPSFGGIPQVVGFNTSLGEVYPDIFIPAGTDPGSSAIDKTIYHVGSVCMEYRQSANLLAFGNSGVGVYNLESLSFVEGKKFVNPDELTMRVGHGVSARTRRLLLTSSQMDTVTMFNTTPGALARIRSFTTWNDVDTVYGVSLVTKDTSGLNYTNGVIGVAKSASGFSNYIVHGTTNHLTTISWATESSPTIVGTPLYLGPTGFFEGSDIIHLDERHILLIGSVTGSERAITLVVVDTSTTSPSIVSTFSHNNLHGFSSPALLGNGVVVIPSTGPTPGVLVIDYTDVNNPTPIEFLSSSWVSDPLTGRKLDTCVVGTTAYIKTTCSAEVTVDDLTYVEEDFLRVVTVDLSDIYGFADQEPSDTRWSIGMDMTQPEIPGEVV